MFLDWLVGLDVEQYCVLTYMVVIGVFYGFNTTILYIRSIVHNIGVENNFLGYTILLGWYCSIIYWFIF